MRSWAVSIAGLSNKLTGMTSIKATSSIYETDRKTFEIIIEVIFFLAIILPTVLSSPPPPCVSVRPCHMHVHAFGRH